MAAQSILVFCLVFHYSCLRHVVCRGPGCLVEVSSHLLVDCNNNLSTVDLKDRNICWNTYSQYTSFELCYFWWHVNSFIILAKRIFSTYDVKVLGSYARENFLFWQCNTAFFELNNHITLPLSSDESKRSDVFASPDRVICVIKFTKEPGKRLGEKNSSRSIKIISTLHKT